MSQTLFRRFARRRVLSARSIFVVALLGAGSCLAQVNSSHSPAALPITPGASGAPAASLVQPLLFESTLSRYQAMTDQKPGSWRDANDTVTRIGGWRAYLKEAQTPDAQVAPKPVSPANRGASNPHAGHGGKP